MIRLAICLIGGQCCDAPFEFVMDLVQKNDINIHMAWHSFFIIRTCTGARGGDRTDFSVCFNSVL